MKLLGLFLFTCLSVTCFAQKQTFKPRSIDIIRSDIWNAEHSGSYVRPPEYLAKYDEFKNQSYVGSIAKPFDLDVRSARIGFAFEFSGRILRQPPAKYGIIIFTNSSEWRFKKNDLYFIADGVRIAVGPAYRDVEYKNGYYSEDLYYSIKAKDFITLAKANEIRIKVGEYEGNLLQDNILSLQKIYKFSQ